MGDYVLHAKLNQPALYDILNKRLSAGWSEAYLEPVLVGT
jgi:hypothetical protein